MNRLQGKVCIVTGAALGIGRASAKLMAAEGARVVVADLDGAGAETVAAAIRDGGGDALAVQMDALQEDSVRAMVETAHRSYGRIDVLYNNVGFTDGKRDSTVLDMDWDYWDTVMRLNLKSTVHATRCTLPLMIAGGGGSLINTASMAAVYGMTQPTAYATAKSGLFAFSRSVAVQYGAKGIRCNTIAPGMIMTTRAPNWPAKLKDIYTKHTPVPRFGQPEDIGHLAVYLASDESGYVTGQVFEVDGGLGIVAPTTADMRELGM
jgi:NAD(P)-dependent dehydrogenase (short-subunit alcohol dehydrogenase family)